MDKLFEHGHSLVFFLKTEEMLVQRTRQTVEVYHALDDLASEVSRHYPPNVKLVNLQNLFLYYGGFLALVSLSLAMDSFLVKQLKRIYRRLARCLASLVGTFAHSLKNVTSLLLKMLTDWYHANRMQFTPNSCDSPLTK